MDSIKTVSVFGASGRVGKEVVKLALLHGYKVKAHCRPGAKCSLKHDNLSVFKGDIFNYELIKDVVEGSECVIITLGHRKPYKDIFCEDSTGLIIKAMEETGASRLVCLTGAMIGDVEDNLTFPFKLLKKVMVKRLTPIFSDRAGQENAVRRSGLQWTLVKPPRLIENGERKIFIYSETLKMGISSSIGFDDLAEFLVEQIASKDYLHKAVYVKY
jgi:putative NADH-flavin reductase